jgi:predicted RNA-binding Zn-ribbon protein involved in translation (DUF1610 family)
VVRAATVIIDHPVVCLGCGNAMHLSQSRTFECDHCGIEVTAEEAFRAFELSEKTPNELTPA